MRSFPPHPNPLPIGERELSPAVFPTRLIRERELPGAVFPPHPNPLPIGERELLGAVFPPHPNPLPIGEREPPPAVFYPSPHEGERTARCGLFPFAPLEKGNCSVRSFPPRPFEVRELLGAVFSPSPLWGEGRGEGQSSLRSITIIRSRFYLSAAAG